MIAACRVLIEKCMMDGVSREMRRSSLWHVRVYWSNLRLRLLGASFCFQNLERERSMAWLHGGSVSLIDNAGAASVISLGDC